MQAADFSSTYQAHHELESDFILVLVVIMNTVNIITTIVTLILVLVTVVILRSFLLIFCCKYNAADA